MRPTIPAIVLALAATPLAAQPADTIARSTDPLFTSRDAVAAGVFVAATVAAYPFDKGFADYMQGAPQTNRVLRRTAIAVEAITEPGAFIIGGALYAIGRASGNERIADLGLHGTEAILVGLGVTTIIKVTVGRARPYVDRDTPYSYGLFRGWGEEKYRSFPSGHGDGLRRRRRGGGGDAAVVAAVHLVHCTGHVWWGVARRPLAHVRR